MDYTASHSVFSGTQSAMAQIDEGTTSNNLDDGQPTAGLGNGVEFIKVVRLNVLLRVLHVTESKYLVKGKNCANRIERSDPKTIIDLKLPGN